MFSSPISPTWPWNADSSFVRATERSSDTAWAEGLRGLAAVGVVSSHMVLCFFRHLVPPSQGGIDGPPDLFQRPIFRLVAQGQAFVALFFILTGFVNSLKPLKQMQSNDLEGALVALAKSSLNRIPRLILPAVTVTILAWFACQLGVFELSRRTDAYWLAVNSRPPSNSWPEAFDDLWMALKWTWIWGENTYDQPQWAMTYLLQASMWVFIALLIASTTRPAFRLAIFALAWYRSWLAADVIVGLNVFAGMFLAELHTSNWLPDFNRFKLLRVLSILSAFLGLYLMSYPSEYQDWQPWSRQLTEIGQWLFPYYADVSRMWPGLGAQILCFSVEFSPDLRRLLSMRFCTWLGSISFSIYLLHGPLMRSVLTWMTFGPAYIWGTELVDGVMPLPSGSALAVILPIFAIFVLAVASLWTCKVEPYFGRITKFIQGVAAAPNEKEIILK